jgi:hypothetical protein
LVFFLVSRNLNRLATHLTDILDKHSFLEIFEGRPPSLTTSLSPPIQSPRKQHQESQQQQKDDGGAESLSLRDIVISDYVETLLTHPSLWRLSIDMASSTTTTHASRLVPQTLRSLDPRIHSSSSSSSTFGDATRTRKLLAVARKWSVDVWKEMMRVVAVEEAGRGLGGSALERFVKGGDVDRA